MTGNLFNEQLSTTFIKGIYLIFNLRKEVEIYKKLGNIFGIKSDLLVWLNQKKEHMEIIIEAASNLYLFQSSIINK